MGFRPAPTFRRLTPSFRTPYVETWTLGIQHAIVNNVVLNVSYVGNHGVNLTGKANPNQPLDGSAWGHGPNGSATGLALYNACQLQQSSGTAGTCDPARNYDFATVLLPIPVHGEYRDG